tara:strand:+ start:495 stop:785 length:291 start_codon:yes stop_codon:yes gene_type:complete
MHVLLVKLTENGLESYQYVNSKFERELGETMRFEGVTMKVGAIGNSRDAVLEYGAKIMRKQNKINRAKFEKTYTIESGKGLFNNEFMNELLSDINS